MNFYGDSENNKFVFIIFDEDHDGEGISESAYESCSNQRDPVEYGINSKSLVVRFTG